MSFRIESKDAFEVYGLECAIGMTNGENWKSVPDFWLEIMSNGALEKLVASAHQPLFCDGMNPVNAILCHYNIDDNTIPYMAFAMKTDQSDTSGYAVASIPTSLWAVFKSDFHTMEDTSHTTQNLVKRVYSEWLPSVKYHKLEGAEMELTYKCGDLYYSEIWIQVKPEECSL